MSDIKQFVNLLRTYDEGGEPAEGWWVAYNDLQKSAEIIERLQSRVDELERQNRNRGAAVVLAQEMIANADERISELESRIVGLSGRRVDLS